MLWQELYVYRQATTASLIDITIIHQTLFLLACVLLGNNRLRALISATFAFSVIHLANIPATYFISVVVFPLTNTENIMEAFLQFPQLYYSGIVLNGIFITVCCLFAAHWLREVGKKPPVKFYAVFNLLFILFPLMVLVFWDDIAMIMSVYFLSLALLGTFLLGLLLFLFYLYTRLTKDNLTAGITETESPLTLTAVKIDKYTPFIQLLSRRELEVIEAVLAGNVRHKQLSAALNISVSTVKTHLIHIYQTTGVSGIAALSSLFHGYTSKPPVNEDT
ncbi:MAG: LuxR C-terminal-related transcriptional regulator, partial [Treponema sp.]|nr:LuxR C-terminal-related transcriptional regulator [Treponema sp.]